MQNDYVTMYTKRAYNGTPAARIEMVNRRKTKDQIESESNTTGEEQERVAEVLC